MVVIVEAVVFIRFEITMELNHEFTASTSSYINKEKDVFDCSNVQLLQRRLFTDARTQLNKTTLSNKRNADIQILKLQFKYKYIFSQKQ